MKPLYPVNGIITVLNTPFCTDLSLDEPALRRHVRLAMEAGVAGFLVPAMASEVYKLTLDERLRMVVIVTEEVDGKIPVFAGAGETDHTKRMEIVKRYLDLGCKNVLLQIPFENEPLFRRQFSEVADLGPENIMLQDWDAQGTGLSDALIMSLFEEISAFRCLKIETVPAGVKYSRLHALTEGRLHLSGGWAVTQMIEGLQRGVHAFMPTGMHFIYTTIFEAFQAGDHERAISLFNDLLPVLAFSNQHLDISIHFYKRLLFRQGIYSTPLVREPILTFDSIHEALADRLIERVIRMEDEIKTSRAAHTRLP
jgi:dihydrodipicolinate synthase/N-acetylneuraminate lyase